MQNYWLVKTEPDAFSWQDLVRDGECTWDGVRNYTARNNLKAMKIDDCVLLYHSITQKAIVGYARVSAEATQDHTTDDLRWVEVRLQPLEQLANPVTLQAIKADERLATLPLIHQSRLSVMPLSKEEFDILLQKSEQTQQ